MKREITPHPLRSNQSQTHTRLPRNRYMLAADHGNEQAMVVLAKGFSSGLFGQAADKERGLAFLRSSAEAGCLAGRFTLGRALEEPHLANQFGLSFDFEQALKLYRKAEEQSPGKCATHIARVMRKIDASKV